MSLCKYQCDTCKPFPVCIFGVVYVFLGFVFRETGFAESEIRVGFVTYAKELHFYNLKVILSPFSLLLTFQICIIKKYYI